MRRVVCWVLICLFTAGFLPSRGEVCRCTAERNCGCACWKNQSSPAAIHDREVGTTPPCCAAKESRKVAACGASHDSGTRPVPSLPESKSGSHDSGQAMDWLTTEPPGLAAPDVTFETLDPVLVFLSNDPHTPPVPPP